MSSLCAGVGKQVLDLDFWTGEAGRPRLVSPSQRFASFPPEIFLGWTALDKHTGIIKKAGTIVA